MTRLEKDFRAVIERATSDNTPLIERDKKMYGENIGTYGELNRRFIECYDRGLITFRETIDMIGENMAKADNAKREQVAA